MTNTAVFDGRRFSPCTELKTKQACLDEIRLQAVQKICRCTPFSMGLQAAFEGNATRAYDYPFCTSDVYGQCWQEADEQTDKQEERAEAAGSCEPCITYKNTYVYKSELNEERWYSSLTIAWYDTDYLLIEERQQFSLAQVVSQVGGDLGLYAGVSVLSLLRLISIFCNMNRKRKEEEASGARVKKDFVPKWCAFFFKYLARSLDSEKDDLEEKIDALEHRVETSLGRFEDWILQLGRMVESRVVVETVAAGPMAAAVQARPKRTKKIRHN